MFHKLNLPLSADVPRSFGGSKQARFVFFSLLGLAFSGLLTSAQAQFLRVGPIYFSGSLTQETVASSNVNSLSKREAKERGLKREDFYLTFGITLTGQGKFYPDIDVNLSTSYNREWHFIQADTDPGNIPFLGDGAFDFSKQSGYLSFSMLASHSANTTREKDTIFVPQGQLLVRDILQQSQLTSDISYARKAMSVNAGYTATRSRHTEEFEEGDSDSQTISGGIDYSPIQRASAAYTYSRSKSELLNPSAEAPPSRWLETQSATVTYRVLQRPSLIYTGGFEKEDDRIVLGSWDPVHTLSLSDSREPLKNVGATYNASYNFDQEEEEDDIGFTYGATVNHDINRWVSHNLNVSRSPVDTFGSTVTSDSTTATYSFRLTELLMKNFSADFSATYSKTTPKGEQAGPTEERTDYRFQAMKSRPIPWSRKLSANLIYDYSYEIPDGRDTFDAHELSLTLTYRL